MSNDSIMVRLRRANPVPETPAGEDNDLFDRITALPRDSVARARPERPTRRRRRAFILVLTVGIAALLASAAFAISQLIGRDVVRPPVTRQEYVDAQKDLALPPGVSWPEFNIPEENSVTSRGAGGGRAVLIAQNAWECYWVDAIKRGDGVAGERAHAELNKLLANNILEAPAGASENWAPTPLPTQPVAVFAHDGGLAWVKQNYALAAAGHPGRLAQSCQANAQ